MPWNRNIEIITHLVFWVFLLVLSTSFASQIFPIQFATTMSAKTVVLMALVAYLNSLVIIPRFFRKGHFGWYFLALLMLIIGALILNHVLSNWLLGDPLTQLAAMRERPRQMRPPINPAFRFVPTFFMLIAILFISTIYQLAKEFRIKERRSDLLQQEKIQHELNFLRSQINPHFLFNALNNLHAMLQLHPEKAGEFVLKLGDMLRYVLEDRQEKKVSLADEISYIQNYLYFQGQKGEKFGQLKFEISGDAIGQYWIEPMLFIPLVENAFQHSYTKKQGDRFVCMNLHLNKGQIHFKIQNSLAHAEAPHPLAHRRETGMGLQNVQRRLELLYPNQYQFEHGPKDNSYLTELIIQSTAL